MFAILLVALGLLACRAVEPSSQRVSNAHASPSPRDRSEPLRVGASGDYPPFSDWRIEEREPAGFSADVARAWAQDQGRTIEWVRFRWSELASDLEARRFDVAFSGVTVRADRSVRGRFSLPLTRSGAVALVDSRSELRTRADLDHSDRRIAVNAGGHLERVARALFPRAQIHPVQRNQDVLGRLGQDGIDVILTDTLEAPLWQAKVEGLRAIGPLTRDRKAAWFARPLEEEARRFDRWLLAAETDGSLARLRSRHALPDATTARPATALLARLDERLSLMVDVARSKHVRGAPIEDGQREERVLEAALRAVRDEARKNEVEAPTAASILRLYRGQIEAAKWIQHDWTARHSSRPTPPTAAEIERAQAELEEDIRPALLFLGDRIAALIVAASRPDSEPHDRPRVASPAPVLSYAEFAPEIERHGLPQSHLRELHAALVEIGVR